ncbi:hypothetical protein [Pseudomonas sp. TWP3-1]|uniref:hypothetical protein n=1 Tax=Pseudomonas sp. TWP3-1 TaxID=2804631 RepID=UPI003CF74D7F
MTTPTSSPISPFALTPVQIPLDITPVSQGHVGLGIVNQFQDSLGVMIVFGPYPGQTPLEPLHLLLNGNPTPISSTVVQSSSAPVLMRMPPGLLLEGINSLKCEVERLSGNRETSPPLDVLYHTFAPGGDDLVAGGGHSKLASSISHPIVDATQAANGVTLTLDYPHKHLYDVITINCGGVIITVQIAPTVADPNPDLTKPIEIILTTQHFANDRNNPQFEIKYNVRSETGNLSGTTQFGVFNPQDHWSKALVVDVRLDQVLLSKAILRENPTDNNDDPAVVDLDKMKGGPLWALIQVGESIWKLGDEIHVLFEAWLNGVLVGTHEDTLTVTDLPTQLASRIPNAKAVADSEVKVTYEQIRAGKIVGVSKVAEAQVIGQGLPDIEDFDGAPNQGASEVGQSVSTSKIKVTLTGKVHSNDSLAIGNFVGDVDAQGQAFYGYLATPNGQTSFISYDVELVGRTANRLRIWIAGGNIFGGAAQFNLVFRDAAGETINTINRMVTRYQRQQEIDTGALNGIKSIAVVSDGQVIIDRIEFL